MSARRPEAIDHRGRHSPEAVGTLASNASGNIGRQVTPLVIPRASLMQEPVLVLNATYEPINVTAVRRAMVLLLKGVAQAEELHSAEVHSSAHSHKVPSVIRLLAYRHIPQQSRALSRKNILVARSEYVPVLRKDISEFGVDAGPCNSALARRPLFLGEFGGVLLSV